MFSISSRVELVVASKHCSCDLVQGSVGRSAAPALQTSHVIVSTRGDRPVCFISLVEIVVASKHWSSDLVQGSVGQSAASALQTSHVIVSTRGDRALCGVQLSANVRLRQ